MIFFCRTCMVLKIIQKIIIHAFKDKKNIHERQLFFMSQKRHQKEICVYEKKSEYGERGIANSWLTLVWTAQRIYKNREEKIYKFTYKHTNTNHMLYTRSDTQCIYETVHEFGTV